MVKQMFKGYLVPHPPLIVKGVGDGSEIPSTRAAYKQIGREICDYDPDVEVIISPHSVLYADYFHISPGNSAYGDFGRFNSPQIKFDVEYDSLLSKTITEFAEAENIPAGFLGERDSKLDHGTMVPLYFTNSRKIVRISLSGFDFIKHYKFGICIKKAIDKLGRKAVIIASGDMSHKLGGNYGFSEFGVRHDEYVKNCIETTDVRKLFAIPPEVAENAAECGLRSIMIMYGIFDGHKISSDVLSYEAPFGVGYMCAKFTAVNKCESLLPLIIEDKQVKISGLRKNEDEFVSLARANVENFVRTNKTIPIPQNLPPEMLEKKSGVFVSIKKNGNLRGCIGTTLPTTENIAAEIIQNGVSACSKDPRFDPITPDELDDLTYSVDVLFPPEKIADETFLDVKKYGVIVSNGYRRGLLLPNLDGVDTVKQQISIAMQKGGISPDEKYNLERFEVVRHI
jgi:AmmeMemoRadiSam system protein A